MYHANGHTVNRNHHNEKRTTMQDRVRKSKGSAVAHGHMPAQDPNPNHIIQPHAVQVDDDGLMTWG